MFEETYDIPIPLYADFFKFYCYSNFVKSILTFLVRNLMSERVAELLGLLRPYTTHEVDDALRRKARFVNDFQRRWEEEKLDAMICPAFYHSAFKSNEWSNELAF